MSNKIEIWVDTIFRCVTKYYLPFFPNHLNMMKRFNSPTVQRQETGWIWPMGQSLLTDGLRDEHVTLRGQSPAMRFNTWTLGGTVCFTLSIPIRMAVLLSTWRNPLSMRTTAQRIRAKQSQRRMEKEKRSPKDFIWASPQVMPVSSMNRQIPFFPNLVWVRFWSPTMRGFWQRFWVCFPHTMQ